jgi:hypothetical protein
VAETGKSIESHVDSDTFSSWISEATTSPQITKLCNVHLVGKLKSTKIWHVICFSIPSHETVTINPSCFNATSELFTF